MVDKVRKSGRHYEKMRGALSRRWKEHRVMLGELLACSFGCPASMRPC